MITAETILNNAVSALSCVDHNNLDEHSKELLTVIKSKTNTPNLGHESWLELNKSIGDFFELKKTTPKVMFAQKPSKDTALLNIILCIFANYLPDTHINVH